MGPAPVLFLFYFFRQLTPRDAPPCVCLPISLFDLIDVPLSLLLHFIPLCGALVVLVLALPSYLGCLALLIYVFFFNLTYSRWTSSLPSCLWSQRFFPSFPGSRLTIFYSDASSALLQLVNQWLIFAYSRSHSFRYERKNTNPTLVRIELTTSALAGVQITY